MSEKTSTELASSPKDTIPAGLRFSGNPFEYKQKNKEKVLLVLAQNPDRWWTITPLAEEIEAGFQSVRSILYELALEHKVVLDSSSGRTYFKLNKDRAGEDLVKLWMGKQEV